MASFTSESVCAGHPDKICDQISDAVLDAVLAQDPYGRVAVETVASFDHVALVGEITANATIDPESIARREIRRLGYTDPKLNFTDKSPVQVFIHAQSPEIAVGVHPKGAGDQGMMFGFASIETKSLMPTPIAIAHRLAEKIDQVRESKLLPYLRPDGKTQVSVRYEGGKPVGVETVVIAVPHRASIKLTQVKQDIFDKVVKPVLAEFGYTIKPKQLIVNGTGIWHMSGPAVDSGLTGRKIVVDSYGGFARVGGGAFSGKDATKVDRSGAYCARYIAKNLVAHHLMEKAEVRLAYYIGGKQPVMQEIEDFGTGKSSDKIIRDFVSKLINTSVEGIIETLNLRTTKFLPTAAYGHFGREGFHWEQIALI